MVGDHLSLLLVSWPAKGEDQGRELEGLPLVESGTTSSG